MKLYNARVRLGGAITNEVNKKRLTAAEIIVLQRIHGADAVQAIAEIGIVQNRSDRRERDRLLQTYPRGPSADGKRLDGAAFLDSVFGVGQPLPKEYVAVPITEESEVEEAEEEITEIETLSAKPTPIKRTRVVAQPAAAADLM